MAQGLPVGWRPELGVAWTIDWIDVIHIRAHRDPILACTEAVLSARTILPVTTERMRSQPAGSDLLPSRSVAALACAVTPLIAQTSGLHTVRFTPSTITQDMAARHCARRLGSRRHQLGSLVKPGASVARCAGQRGRRRRNPRRRNCRSPLSAGIPSQSVKHMVLANGSFASLATALLAIAMHRDPALPSTRGQRTPWSPYSQAAAVSATSPTPPRPDTVKDLLRGVFRNDKARNVAGFGIFRASSGIDDTDGH